MKIAEFRRTLAVAAAMAVMMMQGAPAWAGGRVADLRFTRGINILGYDSYWTDPGKARFHWAHLDAIKRAGFDHVRVNLFAFAHMDDRNRLDPAWLERLDTVVGQARQRGLGVILDEHDFNDCSDDVAACQIKLEAFWRQVAPRYRHQPASVAFELLNEPHGALDADAWNALVASLLRLVRTTNPRRTVIVGPTHWNSLADLPLLKLPRDDDNLLVTFHYYEPFAFTHQGAPWTGLKDKSGLGWGSPSDHERLRQDFAEVAEWARANRRPVLLGEFGAYDRSGTPMILRTTYTAAVAREAERSGFGWAYWQFDSDFLAWDMTRQEWVAPIRDALIAPR